MSLQLDWRFLTEGDVRKILRKRIHRWATPRVSQNDVAAAIGTSPQQFSMILHGERPVSKKVLDYLGLEKVIRYRRKR